MDWIKSKPVVPEKKVTLNPPAVKCACGNEVTRESPQFDQCLECFNRK